MAELLAHLETLSNTHPAIRLLSDETQSLNAEALWHRVTTLSAWLSESGSRVLAVMLDNRVEWVLLDLAARHAGICMVPVPLFFSPEQISHLIEQSGADLLVTEEAIVWPGEYAIDVPEFLSALRVVHLQANTANSTDVSDVARISFTSGSTGRPKGVCLSMTNIERIAESLKMRLSPLGIERHLATLPLATLLENIAGVDVPLLSGAEVVLRRMSRLGFEGSSGFNPLRWAAAITEADPESLILIPQLLQALLALTASGGVTADRIKFIAVGGGKVASQQIEQAHALGLPVYEGYGLTENASVVAVNVPAQSRVGSVGRPFEHLELRFDVDGELYLRGDTLMLGYLGEPRRRAGEWLATGDIGYLDNDGYLYISGRRKNIFINSFGRNLSPEWVESEAISIEGIDQIALIGDARPYNVALIVSRAPDSIHSGIDQLNARLPDYARVKRWMLVEAPFSYENGCLTANGRLQRDRIQTRYRDAIEALYV
ncbi:O-succinylbenzoic acid--CoA ligase [Marinobacterium lacunae]|uniref:O-succinylbenzoic acid--CoA ligase n=1 Tax=Marinobacterium lacunae TaxID=1232683 RepID=A0A081FUB9_9GAMM|nr:AMP-binding protein [Marinobacterium lacunae]KEA62124.1 O-succinylbenzoic acid--CoA ligase [Marinobacterium lacunae]